MALGFRGLRASNEAVRCCFLLICIYKHESRVDKLFVQISAFGLTEWLQLGFFTLFDSIIDIVMH